MSTQPTGTEDRTEKPAEAVTFPARVDRVERAWSSVDSDMPLVIRLARAGLRVPALLAELDDTRAQLAEARAANERISSAWAEVVQREQLAANANFFDMNQVTARAEAAEAALAERDATIARVEALSNYWESSRDAYERWAGNELRAALGGEPETAEPASPVAYDRDIYTTDTEVSDEPARCGGYLGHGETCDKPEGHADRCWEPARCPHGKTGRHEYEPEDVELWRVQCSSCSYTVEGLTKLRADRFAAQHADDVCDDVGISVSYRGIPRRCPGPAASGTPAWGSEPPHTLTEYGTTNCPVESVRAFVDDGECSACGGTVSGTPEAT